MNDYLSDFFARLESATDAYVIEYPKEKEAIIQFMMYLMQAMMAKENE